MVATQLTAISIVVLRLCINSDFCDVNYAA